VIQIDDLWLASYLIAEGGKLAGCKILPYGSGSRMRAVFEIENINQEKIECYSNRDPLVKIHSLRTAINELRDLMYAELQKRNGNGSIKQMPNGGGQRRTRENENRFGRYR
jgi:hypothetical protein